MGIHIYHRPRRMAVVYTVLPRLLHKNNVLCITNNKKHVINNKNEIFATF